MPNWHTAGKSSHIAVTTEEDEKRPNCVIFKSQEPQRLHPTIWTPQRSKQEKQLHSKVSTDILHTNELQIQVKVRKRNLQAKEWDPHYEYDTLSGY
jgi:hypothetical protein